MLTLQLIILFFRLIVPILVISSVVWFVWNSNKRGENSLLWGILAAAAYLLPLILVKKFVRYLQQDIQQSGDNIYALVFSYHIPALLAGVAGFFLLRHFFLVRASRNLPSSESEAVAVEDE